MNNHPRLDPRRSAVPTLVVAALGLAGFLLDAAVNPRPEPVTYLLVPTPVAVLLYLRERPSTDRRRLVGLAAWGFAATAGAGLLTVLVALGTRLPRPYDA